MSFNTEWILLATILIVTIRVSLATDCPENCVSCDDESGKCQECIDTTWGAACQHKCPKNCLSCDRHTGQCNRCIVQEWAVIAEVKGEKQLMCFGVNMNKYKLLTYLSIGFTLPFLVGMCCIIGMRNCRNYMKEVEQVNVDDLPPAYHTLVFTSLPPMVRSQSSTAPPAYDSLSLELTDPPTGLPPPAYHMIDINMDTGSQSVDTEQSTLLDTESNVTLDAASDTEDPRVHSEVHYEQQTRSGYTNWLEVVILNQI